MVRNNLYISTYPNGAQVKFNNLFPFASTFGPMRTPFLTPEVSEGKKG